MTHIHIFCANPYFCFLWYFLNVRHLYTMSLILKSQIIIKNILKITFFFLIYKLILYPLNRFNYRYTDNYRNCWQQKKENIQYSVQIEHCSLAPPLMYRNMRETWFSVNIFLVNTNYQCTVQTHKSKVIYDRTNTNYQCNQGLFIYLEK
jgi:hypothetical protein